MRTPRSPAAIIATCDCLVIERRSLPKPDTKSGRLRPRAPRCVPLDRQRTFHLTMRSRGSPICAVGNHLHFLGCDKPLFDHAVQLFQERFDLLREVNDLYDDRQVFG